MSTISTGHEIYAVLGGVFILGAFVWIGVALRMAYTKMDEMLELLKNCSAVRVRAPLRHCGPWGKLLLVGGISGIVTFPGFYLKRGALNAEDLKNFPAPLKRRLAMLQWTVWGLLVTLLLLWCIGKYAGWLK